MMKTGFLFRAVACAMAVLTALTALATSEAMAQARNLPLIRDAEIEGLLRLYTRPIFKAAGINPKSVRVYIINDQRINAFVAGGQRIFINTGLLSQADTPNEVIGVLAHETGHIAGGHLARMGVEIEFGELHPDHRHADRPCGHRGRRARGQRRGSPGGTGHHGWFPGFGAAQLPGLCARHGILRRPGGAPLPDGHPAVSPGHDQAV